MSSFVIDLDAERREIQHPHGIPVLFHDEQFIFPAEIPADALDPLLSDDLDLMGLLGDILNSSNGDAGVSEVITALFRRPKLPRKFLAAVYEVYSLLLEDQYADFRATRPSLPDYVRLTIRLSQVYGVEMGKLFRSADSSANDSATSSPTSPATTASTPAESGSAQGSPDSSVSDD